MITAYYYKILVTNAKEEEKKFGLGKHYKKIVCALSTCNAWCKREDNLMLGILLFKETRRHMVGHLSIDPELLLKKRII